MKAKNANDFNVTTYHREEVIPLLPVLYQWSLAFQNPPYSFAGFHEDDIIDSQDIMYVNEKNSLVVVAKIDERTVGVGVGVTFDSRYIISHFEKTQKNFHESVANEGYDISCPCGERA